MFDYKNGLFIFILLIMFESYLDPDVTYCSGIYGKLLLLAHHVLSVYLVFGSILLGSPELHVIISTIVVLLWVHNKRCITTVYNNKLCKFEDNYQFKNYFYHFRTTFKANHWVVEAFVFQIFFLMVLDLYLIYKVDN